MAYDVKIADQVRELICRRTENVEEKVMFGGLCFMVEDKICFAVKKDTVLARIAPELYDEEVEKDGRAPMIHGGKPAKTYLFVDLDAIHNHTDLAWWVNKALDYNPLAPLSQAKLKAAAKRRAT